MKALLRTLLLWCMLAGVPFQGFASAAMLLCGPAVPVVTHGEYAGHAAMAHDGHHDGSSHASGEHVRCGGTAACCAGALLLPALPGILPRDDGGHAPAVCSSSMPASADLAGLDRPPKSFLS